MPEFPAWAVIGGWLFIGMCLWLAFLPLWMYNRVKGIERALWAVVSQLQALRREEHADVDPAATRRAREAAAPTGMISTSMFGR
jgi:hypothetical protein